MHGNGIGLQLDYICSVCFLDVGGRYKVYVLFSVSFRMLAYLMEKVNGRIHLSGCVFKIVKRSLVE